MSEVKHTQGDWIIHDFDLETIRHEPTDAVVARVFDGCHANPDIECIPVGEREANARLIAAAPDLLEALEGLIEDVERTRSDFWGLPTQVRNSSVAKAQAAISKAKGDV